MRQHNERRNNNHHRIRFTGTSYGLYLVAVAQGGVTMLDQSNQYIADRRAWKEERQWLEAENARLREALKIIATHNAERGTALETVVIFAAMTLAHEQRIFDNGIDAGKRLSECGELPY